MKKFLSLFLAFLMVASCFAVIPFSTSAAITTSNSGWNGSSAYAPAGSGTEEDPYLVASAANLFWMAKIFGSENASATIYANPFKDKYFVQVCDIDLNGKTMPSIGYYHAAVSAGTAPTHYYVFGGSYDGQGYKIHNGYLGTLHKSHGNNFNWGTGLFGAISGATIKNVNLDNLQFDPSTYKKEEVDTYIAHSAAGMLVGIAGVEHVLTTNEGTTTASIPATTTKDYNVISNCTVSDTCILSSSYPTAGAAWGGLVGVAYNTTIENCTSNATIDAGASPTYVGGIAGFVRDCLIKNCVNTGSIEVAGTSTIEVAGIVGRANTSTIQNCLNSGTIAGGTTSGSVYAGGIVGKILRSISISSCVNSGKLQLNGNTGESEIGGIVGYSTDDTTTTGDITISGCYNTGTFEATKAASSIGVGGILGGSVGLHASGTYKIIGCYNLNSSNTLHNGSSGWRVAGILGTHWANADRRNAFVIENSYSVKVTNNLANNSSYDGSGAKSDTVTYEKETDENYIKYFKYWGTLFCQNENHTGKPAVAMTSTVNCGLWDATNDATAISNATTACNTLKDSITGYVAPKATIDIKHYAAAHKAFLQDVDMVAGSVKPAGSGTKDDPYLIASAENLNWMSQQITKGETEKNVYNNPFKDTYFLQVCDIDLGGKAIYAIGFYNSASEPAYSVFGGNYNGQGFSIRNGYVKESNTSKDRGRNINWVGGFFGAIYGATIENVNLENIKVGVINLGGVLVGRAVAPRDGAAPDANFNVIRNCSTDADCFVQNYESYASSDTKQDTAYRVGGIVGMAESVTIENCTNGATLYANGVSAAGGIAGTVGHATLINNCVNTGTIVYTAELLIAEAGLGGIAGSIVSNETATAPVRIANCYNTGHFEGAFSTSNTFYYGGILGGANSLGKNATYTVENCFNNPTSENIYISEYTSENYCNSTPIGSGARVSSIVGCTYVINHTNNGSDVGYIDIIDCYGTAVTGSTTGYTNAGVVIMQGSNLSKHATVKRGAKVTLGDVSYTFTTNTEGTYTVNNAEATTVSGLTILESAAVAAKITEATITGATGAFVDPNAAVVGNLSVQKHNEDTTVRFVAEIDQNVAAAAFEIIASYKVKGEVVYSKLNHFDCDYVYLAVNAEGGLENAPAGKYFALVRIDDIPADRGDVTFYVTPMVQKTEDAEWTKGATLIYTYDMEDLTDLSETTVGINAPAIGYGTAVGAFNVAEALQKKLSALGANATLVASGANITFDVNESLADGTWKIVTTANSITVTADTAHGLIAAYEYMLPKLGLATDLTTVITSATGSYEVDETAEGELRIMYHNIKGLSGYTTDDRVELLKLTYAIYQPDVICLQEARADQLAGTYENPKMAVDFSKLATWLEENGYEMVTTYSSVANATPIYVKNTSGITKGNSGFMAAPNMGNGDKGTTWAVLTYQGKNDQEEKSFIVLNSHFAADSNTLCGDSNEYRSPIAGNELRYQHAVAMIDLIKTIRTTNGNLPVITGGDFNAVLHAEPGTELTMGWTYKQLVEYDDLDEATKANYKKDAKGYAYKFTGKDQKEAGHIYGVIENDKDGNKLAEKDYVYVLYLQGDADTNAAGGLTPVRHIAKEYVDKTPTGYKVIEIKDGETFVRYGTVVSGVSSYAKGAIDHVLYLAGDNTTVTFNQYKILEDCLSLTSSDHAPHYVDIVLN